MLVKTGFRGPIFANPATIELTALLLKDSAHLQEEDARHPPKGPSDRPEHEPMYTSEDVDPVLKLMKPMPRSGEFTISESFKVTSYDAGHILGSSSLTLTISEDGAKKIVVFSGDVGRYDQPILNDPRTPLEVADVLICESTYGDRDHPAGDAAALLAEIVNRVAKRGGSIVIPAFAIGRTQTFMYYLRQLEDENKIPRLPVYVDSPMAVSATDLYLKYGKDHDLEFAKIDAGGTGDPLNVREFHLTRSVEESKAINNVTDPVHHRFGERDGGGGAGAASPGPAVAGSAQCCAPCGLPGTGDARACIAGRRENPEIVWPGCGGECGNYPDEPAFGARG